MEEASRREIQQECERLSLLFAHLVDFGEAEKAVDLFTPDGVFEAPGIFLEGQEKLRKGFGARQHMERTSRHVCTNILIHPIDENRAEGVVYLTLYQRDGENGGTPASLRGPIAVGNYRDYYRRVDGAWRIAHRRFEVAFAPNGDSMREPVGASA